MDRVLRLAFVLAAAILAGPSPAKADVDYSSHDLGENAVTVGDRAYRLFRLPLAAPADLAVTVHATDFDPVLFLIPPDRRPLFNDDARGLDAALAVPRAAAGDWYLAVGSFAPANGGNFTLALAPAEAAAALADASDSAGLAGLTALLVRPPAPPATSPMRPAAAERGYADYRGMIVAGTGTGDDRWSNVIAGEVVADAPRPRPADDQPPVPAPVPAGPATTAAAPTELPPLLPWPPPEPSARMQVPRSLFLRGDPAASLGDVDDRLRAALSANGYAEVGYFGVPEGFALVTRLERFEPGGISAAGPARWSLEMPPLATFDLFAYVRVLLAAETGHFRVIAFVVTSAPFAAGEAGIDTETLARWSSTGTNALPVAVRAWPFGEGHAVTALVYEFSRVRGGRSVKLNLPSETSAQEHLTASHILASLEGR